MLGHMGKTTKRRRNETNREFLDRAASASKRNGLAIIELPQGDVCTACAEFTSLDYLDGVSTLLAHAHGHCYCCTADK